MQDNKSSILMHENYPCSIHKGSKHVNVRYFFVVDKTRKKELKVEHFPTADMLRDYSSKPSQGRLFVKQWNLIQGVKEEYFKVYKGWFCRVLEKYGLWDDEEKDLDEL